MYNFKLILSGFLLMITTSAFAVWDCPHCTFTNDDSLPHCEICENKREPDADVAGTETPELAGVDAVVTEEEVETEIETETEEESEEAPSSFGGAPGGYSGTIYACATKDYHCAVCNEFKEAYGDKSGHMPTIEGNCACGPEIKICEGCCEKGKKDKKTGCLVCKEKYPWEKENPDDKGPSGGFFGRILSNFGFSK